MKRETVKASVERQRGKPWWPALGVAGAVAVGAGLWFYAAREGPVGEKPQTETSATAGTPRFAAQPPLTQAELQTLRWEEINQLLQTVGADAGEIERLIQLVDGVHIPPAIYLRALLLILQQTPEKALATFDTLDHQAIPPAFLYAPHRLQQTLHPDSPDPYLTELRTAVAEGKVPPLIRARVQAVDGKLREALGSYMRTDPGSWARYDLESLQRIGTHQGLATDLRKLIAGALASGRVQKTLVAPLREVARSEAAPPDVEDFKRQLRHEIEANTPAGQIAIASAKQLINDRKLFVGRKYAELIASHRESEPIKLSTETVLLLFLSAVELKEQIETDRWGQELKRRHRDAEVKDWVTEMTASAQ